MKQIFCTLIILLCFATIGGVFQSCSKSEELVLNGNELFKLIVQDKSSNRLFKAELVTEFDRAIIKIDNNTDTLSLAIYEIIVSYNAKANYAAQDFITLQNRKFSISVTSESNETKIYSVEFEIVN